MSSYAAPRRDGDFSNDPTHERPYDDSFYGQDSESLFQNSYSLDQHDPYRDDPTHFSHTPSDTDHLTEFVDEYADDPYNQQQGFHGDQSYSSFGGSQYRDPHDPRYGDGVYDEYDQSHTGGGDDNESIPESQYTYDTATRRDFQYSTANVKRHGWCYKFCCIFLLFMLFFAISTIISMLIQKLFFDDDGAAEDPIIPDRDLNATFPRDRSFINRVCGMGMVDVDGGARCREDCEPQFSECCYPFLDLKVLNFTSFLEVTNATLPPHVETEDQDILLLRQQECSISKELQGCLSYAKCQAVKNNNRIDPAPASLPHLCGEMGLHTDPDSCEDICRGARCCFNDEGESCLADNLDICMDYAPCQNLRDNTNNLMTAPYDLDENCYLRLPECEETCKQAACCSDPTSRCYQENFMACLTYAPCNNVSETVSITVPEIFSRLPMPPTELIFACDEKQTVLEQEHLEPCATYCEQASCCYESNQDANCFHEDPLGCLLWHQHCQVETDLAKAWWTGKE
jgi:hypothetical protein